MKELDDDDKYWISQKMIEQIEDFPRRRYKGGRPEDKLLVITYSYLSDYFGVSKLTISRWIDKKKLDPTSIESIYNLKHSGSL